MKTLGEFVVKKQHEFSYATGELTALLPAIKLSAEIIRCDVNRAGLVDVLGASGVENMQGEVQQKLDLPTSEKLKAALKARDIVAGTVSEEEDGIVVFEDCKHTRYVVLMDPLGGSFNIDVNVSVSTIFSIYRRVTPVDTPVTEEDFLQPGNKQVTTGYAVCGPSTMLVYTTSYGVHAFTYDPSLGVLCLSQERMRLPAKGSIYSISEGNYVKLPDGVKKYVRSCQEEDKPAQRSYTSRYIGPPVADFHRNPLKDGIYLYPSTASHPQGKLHLLYECNPIAFLAKQAGGKANNDKEHILDTIPENLHQRRPSFVGNDHVVEDVEHFIREFPDA